MEKSLLRRHPWLFAGAIERIEGHAGRVIPSISWPALAWLHGEAPSSSDAPPVIEEYVVRIQVDIFAGHQTGFYLDPRANRRRLATLARVQLFLLQRRLQLAGAGGWRPGSGCYRFVRAGAGHARNLALNPQSPATA